MRSNTHKSNCNGPLWIPKWRYGVVVRGIVQVNNTYEVKGTKKKKEKKENSPKIVRRRPATPKFLRLFNHRPQEMGKEQTVESTVYCTKLRKKAVPEWRLDFLGDGMLGRAFS